jgi:hypothetical protein
MNRSVLERSRAITDRAGISTSAATLEPHRNPDDQRRAVEPGLDAAHHAALAAGSSPCRSSPTRLASPSALTRTSSGSFWTSTRSTRSRSMAG